MGYLKRLADRRYRIKYDVIPANGRVRQLKTETLEGYTKQEAEAILAQRKAEVTKQRATIANGEQIKDEVLLSELLEGFLGQKRMKKEANTIRRYEALVKLYLNPKFGDRRAKHLKPFHLIDAYTEWQENGRGGRAVSAKTIRHVHELFRNVLNWGVRREVLSRNVAALIDDDDLPKVVKPKPLALTQDELRKLLDEAKNPSNRSKKRGYMSAQPWFFPAVVFAAYTGARRGEVLALRWAEVNLELRFVTISRSITERMEFKSPKNDKSRTISMPETLRSILKSHRASQAKEKLFLGGAYRDNDLVFAHADGSPVGPWNFGRAVLDCIRRAKVAAITLHGLRDTHASLCAKAGVPLEVISRRLGHASIGITAERYLHVYSERDAEAATAFDELVG
jgi:integrase